MEKGIYKDLTDEEIVEKIKNKYTIRFLPGNTLYIGLGSKKKQVHAFGNFPVCLTFDEIDTDLPEDEIRAKGVKITPKEITQKIYPECYEKYACKYVMDEKTGKYIESVKAEIGFLNARYDDDFDEIELKYQYEIGERLTGSGYVDVGINKEGNWVAQFSVRTDIDDYRIFKFDFSKKPSIDDILTARAIEKLDILLTVKGFDTVNFICEECGRECHFVDINASSFREKFRMFKEDYCGC